MHIPGGIDRHGAQAGDLILYGPDLPAAGVQLEEVASGSDVKIAGWIQAEGHAATVGVPQEPNLVPIGAVLERRCFAVKASPEPWTAVRRSSSDVDSTIGTDGDGGSGIGAKLPIRIRPWSIVPSRPKRVTGGVILHRGIVVARVNPLRGARDVDVAQSVEGERCCHIRVTSGAIIGGYPRLLKLGVQETQNTKAPKQRQPAANRLLGWIHFVVSRNKMP